MFPLVYGQVNVAKKGGIAGQGVMYAGKFEILRWIVYFSGGWRRR